jgi:hypothetical protein
MRCEKGATEGKRRPCIIADTFAYQFSDGVFEN